MLCEQVSPAELLNTGGEMLFDAFMRNTPAVAFIKDPDGRILYVNRLYEKLWRTTLAECQGKSDDELWPPEVARQIRIHDLQVLQSGERIEVTESIPMPDGTTRKFLISRFSYADLQGSVFLGGIGIDITAHQEAEDELGKQACQQSVIARLASQALFQNDIGSVLADATMLTAQVLNVEYCGFFEFRDVRPVLRAGTGWNDLDLGQELAPYVRSQISYTYEFGEPINASQHDAQTFVNPQLFIEHGIQSGMTDVVRCRTRTLGVLGAFSKSDRTWTSDEATFLRTVAALIGGIEMRFEAESALSTSESRYRRLFMDAPAAYHEIDCNGCIRKVNHTECEWLGYSESELLGRPIWELVAEGERDASEAAVRRKLASSGALMPFRRTYQRRDGTSVVFQISERRMLDGDSMHGMCSIMIPVS